MPTPFFDAACMTHPRFYRDCRITNFRRCLMKPHDLKKGCDNYWYDQATKDGQTVDVVLPPGGQPFTTHGS